MNKNKTEIHNTNNNKDYPLHIPMNRIISITDLLRHYRDTSRRIEDEGINFIFSRNEPDKVIMSLKSYSELMSLIESKD